MAKINPSEVSAQIQNRKVDRVDIEMLLALERAPDRTLRLEDRMETALVPPPPNAPRGSPNRPETKIIYGLRSLVDSWCDSRLDLTVKEQKPIIEKNIKTGETIEHPVDPIAMRFSISRLERMTDGNAEVRSPIEHVGGADEETAKMPTRFLKLSEVGEIVLSLWRSGKIPGVPHPDPAEPKAERREKQQETVKA